MAAPQKRTSPKWPPVKPGESIWKRIHQSSPLARFMADRHYSRKKKGAKGMMPPGRQCVLATACRRAVFALSWPDPQYVNRAFPDAWVNTIFRNESPYRSSELIRSAIATARHFWADHPLPADGVITFVHPEEVAEKEHPGFCYRRAKFQEEGTIGKKGHIILRLPQDRMPEPERPCSFIMIAEDAEIWDQMSLQDSMYYSGIYYG